MVRFDPGHISLLIYQKSMLQKKTDNNKHRRINEPSKSSVVSSSIIKTTLDIVTQGYAEFLGGFKGVIEIDGDRCG